MAVKKSIVWFHEVDKHDIGLVGGKGANLGEMTQAGFPIPYGFIVTSEAYFEFVREHKLDKKIRDIIGLINYENSRELHNGSSEIKKLILENKPTPQLTKEVINHYEELLEQEERYLKKSPSSAMKVIKKLGSLYTQPFVAVRSSATAEDLPDASFAGQQETYLNVKGAHQLVKKVQDCWASLFTERAIYYRQQKGFDHFKVGLAAVVQRMIQADKSGIAFSIDPVTNNKASIIIEAVFGLGEYIVGGRVTPDHYEVDKRSLLLLKREAAYQNIKLVRAGRDNKEVKLSKKVGTAPKLTDSEITRVAVQVRSIEKHYYFPQDIEWAIEGESVYIVQSRPITTIKEEGDSNDSRSSITDSQAVRPILTGSPASPGIGVGPATIIKSPKEIDKIKSGDILVAPQTNPDYVPAMKRARAIVTEKGGRTSHAAIVSRELGIPAVVGAEGATKKVKTGDVISVNGATGEVFKGSVLSNQKEKDEGKKEKVRRLETKTKVYVNLAEPDQADKVSKMNVDGIGLLRAEFMVAHIGKHPRQYIKEKKEKQYIDRLASDLIKFARPFNPRPIIYRATDFKTNEYKHLEGGSTFEPKEENPMLGFRGASRYIVNPEVFALELAAIKQVWSEGFQNLHLMIPFLRVPSELVQVKKQVKDHGLLDLPGFKFFIMAEVPSCALNLDKFLDVGIDGVSIGTNDLTMMLLGVDRDNEKVANIYDERNPVVINMLEQIVKTCRSRGVTSSICGQAASDYPEIVEVLIRAGVTSVSVNPDTIDQTRSIIHNLEKKHKEK